MNKRLTLLIDADDTILDFAASERDSVILLCKDYGIENGEEVAAKFKQINRRLWDMFERGEITREDIFYTRFEELFEYYAIKGLDVIEVGDAYRENMVHSKRIIHGARACINRLSQSHDLYCVTNGLTRTQKMRMKSSGLGKYFKKLYISQEMELSKPSKAFFDFVLKDVGEYDLNKTYIIGDSLSSDIQGGINAGIKTILFNKEGKAVKDVVPDFEVKSFRELEKLVSELSRK
ncbi:MAG: YjjG family noncanonical pyrimidine nucleotidase [Clostridia bacterium]|nr:YjjG family noncanonical pyrimidine nucleotidase [Clostridia bacterium]MDE7329175.1 YjjG family noncanonical pyrimidine nucleotidase [Clostridia bacterium]